MKLHDSPNEFHDLIAIVAEQKHLPESAIERDYYIVYTCMESRWKRSSNNNSSFT